MSIPTLSSWPTGKKSRVWSVVKATIVPSWIVAVRWPICQPPNQYDQRRA